MEFWKRNGEWRRNLRKAKKAKEKNKISSVLVKEKREKMECMRRRNGKKWQQ